MTRLPAIRMESVACVRFEAPPGSGRYVGCGKGWTQLAWQPPGPGNRCPDCDRPLLVTGRFLKADLRPS